MARNFLYGVLKEDNFSEDSVELKYEDPLYEVYSYSIGDGIWGDRFECDYKDLPDWLKRQVTEEEYFDIWLGLKTKKVTIPFNVIEYTIINRKTKKPVKTGLNDLTEGLISGITHNENGETIELDNEDSIFRKLGLI